jgi:2-amino-4-hydroxy-6-hydroxymethyldihydropteridine diphosphokinase
VTSERTAVAWVSLGANLGRRTAALAALRRELTRGSVTVEAASRELLTRAVGVRRQPDFHNQVVRLRSPAPWRPEAWLGHCERAAQAAGRRPTYRWGPRRADADVLLLGDRGEVFVDRPGLRVPHPELAQRPFLCALLAELDPTLRLPDGRLLAELGGVFYIGSRSAS